ncbi:hypothetical protein FBU30_002371, partial [Linnemannia zychae]
VFATDGSWTPRVFRLRASTFRLRRVISQTTVHPVLWPGIVVNCLKHLVDGYQIGNRLQISNHVIAGRLSTFHRQHTRDMDYICPCGNAFTLNTSLRCHYKTCEVAADTVRLSSNHTESSMDMDTDNNSGSSASAQIATSSIVRENLSQPIRQAYASGSTTKHTR